MEKKTSLPKKLGAKKRKDRCETYSFQNIKPHSKKIKHSREKKIINQFEDIDELSLITIFSFLSDLYIRKRIGIVSKKWNELSKSNIIWEDRFYNRFIYYNVKIEVVEKIREGLLNYENERVKWRKRPITKNQRLRKNFYFKKYRHCVMKRCYFCGLICSKSFKHTKFRTCTLHNLKNCPSLYLHINGFGEPLYIHFLSRMFGFIKQPCNYGHRLYLYEPMVIEYLKFIGSFNLDQSVLGKEISNGNFKAFQSFLNGNKECMSHENKNDKNVTSGVGIDFTTENN